MALERDQPQDESQERGSGVARRWGIWLALLAAAFLIGFVPMWLSSRTLNDELRDSRRELRRSQIENLIGSAAVDARRGEYEPARQAASRFFTELDSELDKPIDSVLTQQEKSQVAPALSGRDDIITLLSRNDPAATERLSDLYVAYRQATSGG